MLSEIGDSLWSDGEKLVEMLEDLELGLKPIKAYEIDESFFNEFRD